MRCPRMPNPMDALTTKDGEKMLFYAYTPGSEADICVRVFHRVRGGGATKAAEPAAPGGEADVGVGPRHAHDPGRNETHTDGSRRSRIAFDSCFAQGEL